MTDEKISSYAAMETEDGEFCGDTAAKKDVDSICMNALVSANRSRVNAKKSQFAWDLHKNGSEGAEDGVSAAIADILK